MKTLTQETGKSGLLSYGLFKRFKSKLSKYDDSYDANVLWSQYQRICKKFNKRNMESIIKGKVFVMPYKLGNLGIVQYKKRIHFNKDGKLLTKGLVPDWHKTYKLWKELYPECKKRSDYKDIQYKQVVYMTNEHTDGRIFKFHWKKKYCNIKNISAYRLVIPPQYKAALGRLIMGNPNIQYCTKF